MPSRPSERPRFLVRNAPYVIFRPVPPPPTGPAPTPPGFGAFCDFTSVLTERIYRVLLFLFSKLSGLLRPAADRGPESSVKTRAGIFTALRVFSPAPNSEVVFFLWRSREAVFPLSNAD